KKQYENNDLKGDKPLEIETKLTKEEIKIKGTRELFNRAIYNIIENSIKYSKDSIFVTIETDIVEGKLIITIKDDGIGISKEDQKLIFDRFYRIEQSRNRKTGGSGLGLAIVKTIVDTFDGKVSVTSKINKGSTFTISLPLK
ncbi:MAG TPA: ATP-binding protein, partial [Candidatus Dojkabacteria bacterium]|nr:ATP-binding protein [Candidatus Dojkabacteria bacterium]